MTPLGAVCVGFLLVLVDLRVPALDVVPDPFGWMLVVAGTARIAALDRRFLAARWLVVMAGLLSLFDVVSPTGTQPSGTGTTESAVAPEGLLGVLVTGYQVISFAATVALCLALRDRARDHDDDSCSRRFALLAAAQAVVGVAVVAVSAAGLLGAPREPQSDAVRAGIVVAVLGALAVGVWFLLALARSRHLPWLQDREVDAGSSGRTGTADA